MSRFARWPSGTLGPWVLAAVGYAALTLIFMWPVVAHLSTALPHDIGDPALNTWILWWNAHNLPLTARWSDAPIFWPVRGAFSFSEHLLGISIVTTPLQWLGATPLTVHNVAFLLSYPLCALAAHALAWTITKRHDAAVLAGLVFGFSPYRVSQLPHLQVLWAFGMPLALLALHRYVEDRRGVWLALFAAAWVLQALANGYYLMFFPLLLACWVLWFTMSDRRDAAVAITGTWAASSLVLVPALLMYQRIHAAFGLQRGIGEIESLSADATALFATSPNVRLWHGLSRWSRPEGELFPGAFALAVVTVAGVAALWTTRRRAASDSSSLRRTRAVLWTLTAAIVGVALSAIALGPWRIARDGSVFLSVGSPDKPLSIALVLAIVAVLVDPGFVRVWRRRSLFAFYTLAAALMFVLSLGPRARVAGASFLFRAPYAWLLQLPGFSGLRVPARLAMLFVLCLAIAAALAFVRLTSAFGRRAQVALACAACAVITAESWPTVAAPAATPPIQAVQRADPSAPVLELPLGVIERDIAAVYRSIDYRRPVINGYSGYVPPHYVVLQAALRADDDAVLAELARNGPLTVVVDHREQFARWSQLVSRRRGEVIEDDGEWRVYRLAPQPQAPAAIEGAPLAIRSVAANVGSEWASQMIDGDTRTEWNSRRVQAGGEEVAIELDGAHDVSALRLSLGPFVADYPRRLSVDCGGDRGEWQECWTGSTGALALRAALDDPRVVPMTIPIARNAVRRLRLRQTAADAENGWSIAELTVFGRD